MARGLVEIGKELIEKKESFVAAGVIDTKGSSPRKKGAWMIVEKNGTCYGTVGGGILDAHAQEMALSLFESKDSFVHRFKLDGEKKGGLDMRCGGDVKISFEYIDGANATEFLKGFKSGGTAYIFGGGHVGAALEPILRFVNFETVVIDDREEFANRSRFPYAKDVQVVESYNRAFDNVVTDKHSFIVIVTRGHAGDFEVLKQSLERETAYVGMIGSKGKVAETFRLLREIGIDEERISRVDAPIGLAIHAETPEEIAISIAGEMINVRAIRKEKNEGN